MLLARAGMPTPAPRPLAHARHQPDLDESHHDTRPGTGVLDLRGSSAKRHVLVARKQRGNAQTMKSEPEDEDQDVKKNIMKKNMM